MAERREIADWDRASLVTATILSVNMPEGECVDPTAVHPLRGGGKAAKPGSVALDTDALHTLVKPMLKGGG